MQVGVYEVDSAVSQRLLRALPALLTLPATAWDSPLVPLLGDEIVKVTRARKPCWIGCSICC